jgi:dienelactone hydrolase
MAALNRSKSWRKNSGDLRFLLQVVGFLLFLGFAGIGKAEHPRSTATKSLLPDESRFVKFDVAIPGSDRRYPVWRTRSTGRPILLLHAINGLSPDLLNFALVLEDWGYRAYLPSLYGDPVKGRPAYGYDKGLASIKVIRRTGIWNPVSTESAGTIVSDLAHLARTVSAREGGRSIAVIGNSLTGSFPLALLEESCVRLAVMGQPAVPAKRVPRIIMRLPHPPEETRSLTLTEGKWEEIVRAMQRHPRKTIIGFHYLEDPMAEIERFDELHERLSRAGLARRFTAYVKTPADHPFADERRSWVVASETSETPRTLTPHSTYLDAADPQDLAWFRTKLKNALARAW